MSELICPFCQQWLIPCIQNQNDWIYHCDNPKCPMYDDADIENAKHPLASEDLWQELIRTRKALDVAIRGLDQMTWGCDSSDAEHLLKEIKEITAQEQKD